MAQVGYHISFRSRAQGPIESGAIHRHVRDYEKDVAEELAKEALDTWESHLDARIRHQTPYYREHTAKRKIAWNRWKIHDHGIIYGNWLESGAYTPRTIFPGYWSMRDTKAQWSAGPARRAVAEEVLARHQARGRLI